MTTVRQDAWTEEDDLLLAEVVLQYIREGGTQLAAFKEVGSRLNRTSSACGFRWNSFVRKQYRHVIEDAKRARKEGNGAFKREKKKEKDVDICNPYESIDSVISFLRSLKGEEGSTPYDIISLLKENAELKECILQLETKMDLLENEYKALFDFIDKKRGTVCFEDKKKDSLLRERNIYLEK